MTFLRQIFGPSLKEIWLQFSKQIGGTVVKDDSFSCRIDAPHQAWSIMLGTEYCGDGQSFTTVSVPYRCNDGFQFSVFRGGHLVDLFREFRGKQSLDVGFDKLFTVEGTDVFKLRELFAQETIRRGVKRQETGFSISAKLNKKNSSSSEVAGSVQLLCLHVPEVVKDPDYLKSLYDLLTDVLDFLCRIGSASEYKPGVVLE